MPRPIIALLTDFGSRDHYVGSMKGVILGICPDATLVDITHDIAPQDVLSGALELSAAFSYFPPGTVFVAVVDPGVGSGRRAIAAEADEYRFVGPDNGVLALALEASHGRHIVELTEARYARPTVSRTFEGRDRFAPAAAWLGRGVELRALGRPIDTLQRLEIPQPSATPEGLGGEVLSVDRFGNLITNIDRKAYDLAARGGATTVWIHDHVVPKVVSTYADVAAGEMCALFGSSGHLEIAMNGGSAAHELAARRGAAVRVRSEA
jgi:S-adenosylmethionine hydrolase